MDNEKRSSDLKQILKLVTHISKKQGGNNRHPFAVGMLKGLFQDLPDTPENEKFLKEKIELLEFWAKQLS
jgi:hypothetical protein